MKTRVDDLVFEFQLFERETKHLKFLSKRTGKILSEILTG
jgi:hypothetical protein